MSSEALGSFTIGSGSVKDPDKLCFRMISLPASHVRYWGGNYVVYDQRCGETHVLQGTAGKLFGWLNSASYTISELVALLGTEPLKEETGTEAFVRQVLDEFQRHQLLDEIYKRR